MNRSRPFKALVACFTIVAFLTTSVIWVPDSFAAAQAIRVPAPTAPEVSIPYQSKLDPGIQFSIPQELGTLQYFKSGKGPMVVHLQTAHGHYQAQKQIQAILHHLDKQYGIRTLLVEGSAFKLEPKILNFFPEDPAITQKVNDALTKAALVKGPELYLLDELSATHNAQRTKEKSNSLSAPQAYGIENLEAYRENGVAFVNVLTAKKKTEHFLIAMNDGIDRLVAAYLNDALRGYLKRLESFEKGQMPLEAWLFSLKKEALKRLKLDLAQPSAQLDWPMLVRILKIQELSSKFNKDAFMKERGEFLKAIGKFLPHNVQSATRNVTAPSLSVERSTLSEIESLLNSQSQSMQLPALETSLLFEDLVKALPRDFNYEAYPNVCYFIGRLLLQSELKTPELMQETERLSSEIADKLAKTKAEKELVILLKDYRSLQKLFALELTPADHEQILSRNENNLKPSSIIKRLQDVERNASSVARVKGVHFAHIADLDRLFTVAMQFYAGVKERDGLMEQMIEKRLQETGADKVAVITGGFHSEPFKNYFSSKDYSYALISPRITGGDDKGHEAYVQNMLYFAQRATGNAQRGVASPISLSVERNTLSASEATRELEFLSDSNRNAYGLNEVAVRAEVRKIVSDVAGRAEVRELTASKSPSLADGERQIKLSPENVQALNELSDGFLLAIGKMAKGADDSLSLLTRSLGAGFRNVMSGILLGEFVIQKKGSVKFVEMLEKAARDLENSIRLLDVFLNEPEAGSAGINPQLDKALAEAKGVNFSGVFGEISRLFLNTEQRVLLMKTHRAQVQEARELLITAKTKIEEVIYELSSRSETRETKKLGFWEMREVPPERIASIKPELIPLLTRIHLLALTQKQIMAFTMAQIQALTERQKYLLQGKDRKDRQETDQWKWLTEREAELLAQHEAYMKKFRSEVREVSKSLAEAVARRIRYSAALGKPGSGKGTLLQRFVAELNRHFDKDHQYVILSTGDVFRAIAEKVTAKKEGRDPDPKKVGVFGSFTVPDSVISAMQAGKIISDEITIDLVNEVLRLDFFRKARGIFFDGFPRSSGQLAALDQGRIRIGDKPLTMDFNFILDIEDQTVYKRAASRVADEKLAAAREKREPKLRKDDLPEAVEKRITDYKNVTSPAVETKRGQPDTLAIDANVKPITGVYEDFLQGLDAWIATHPARSEVREKHGKLPRGLSAWDIADGIIDGIVGSLQDHMDSGETNGEARLEAQGRIADLRRLMQGDETGHGLDAWVATHPTRSEMRGSRIVGPRLQTTPRAEARVPVWDLMFVKVYPALRFLGTLGFFAAWLWLSSTWGEISGVILGLFVGGIPALIFRKAVDNRENALKRRMLGYDDPRVLPILEKWLSQLPTSRPLLGAYLDRILMHRDLQERIEELEGRYGTDARSEARGSQTGAQTGRTWKDLFEENFNWPIEEGLITAGFSVGLYAGLFGIPLLIPLGLNPAHTALIGTILAGVLYPAVVAVRAKWLQEAAKTADVGGFDAKVFVDTLIEASREARSLFDSEQVDLADNVANIVFPRIKARKLSPSQRAAAKAELNGRLQQVLAEIAQLGTSGNLPEDSRSVLGARLREIENSSSDFEAALTSRSETRFTPEEERIFRRAMQDLKFRWTDLFLWERETLRRVSAVKSLGAIENPALIPELYSLLAKEEKENGVKTDEWFAIAGVLLQKEETRILGTAIDSLTNDIPVVRQRAANFLGENHVTSAVPALTMALKDSFVKFAAAEAIEKITGIPPFKKKGAFEFLGVNPLMGRTTFLASFIFTLFFEKSLLKAFVNSQSSYWLGAGILLLTLGGFAGFYVLASITGNRLAGADHLGRPLKAKQDISARSEIRSLALAVPAGLPEKFTGWLQSPWGIGDWILGTFLLGMVGATVFVALLMTLYAVGSTWTSFQKRSIQGLEKKGDPGALESLRSLLRKDRGFFYPVFSDVYNDVELAAIAALTRLNDPLLVGFLTSGEGFNRYFRVGDEIKAAVDHWHPEAFSEQFIQSLMKHDLSAVQLTVKRGDLAKLGILRPLLVAAFSHPDPRIQRMGLDILVNYESLWLDRVSADHEIFDPAIRKALEPFLQKSISQTFDDDLFDKTTMIMIRQGRFGEIVPRALGRLSVGNLNRFPLLVKELATVKYLDATLSHADLKIRALGLEAIEGSGTATVQGRYASKYQEQLLPLLQDPDHDVFSGAAILLAGVGRGKNVLQAVALRKLKELPELVNYFDLHWKEAVELAGPESLPLLRSLIARRKAWAYADDQPSIDGAPAVVLGESQAGLKFDRSRIIAKKMKEFRELKAAVDRLSTRSEVRTRHGKLPQGFADSDVIDDIVGSLRDYMDSEETNEEARLEAQGRIAELRHIMQRDGTEEELESAIAGSWRLLSGRSEMRDDTGEQRLVAAIEANMKELGKLRQPNSSRAQGVVIRELQKDIISYQRALLYVGGIGHEVELPAILAVAPIQTVYEVYRAASKVSLPAPVKEILPQDIVRFFYGVAPQGQEAMMQRPEFQTYKALMIQEVKASEDKGLLLPEMMADAREAFVRAYAPQLRFIEQTALWLPLEEVQRMLGEERPVENVRVPVRIVAERTVPAKAGTEEADQLRTMLFAVFLKNLVMSQSADLRTTAAPESKALISEARWLRESLAALRSEIRENEFRFVAASTQKTKGQEAVPDIVAVYRDGGRIVGTFSIPATQEAGKRTYAIEFLDNKKGTSFFHERTVQFAVTLDRRGILREVWDAETKIREGVAKPHELNAVDKRLIEVLPKELKAFLVSKIGRPWSAELFKTSPAASGQIGPATVKPEMVPDAIRFEMVDEFQKLDIQWSGSERGSSSPEVFEAMKHWAPVLYTSRKADVTRAKEFRELHWRRQGSYELPVAAHLLKGIALGRTESEINALKKSDLAEVVTVLQTAAVDGRTIESSGVKARGEEHYAQLELLANAPDLLKTLLKKLKQVYETEARKAPAETRRTDTLPPRRSELRLTDFADVITPEEITLIEHFYFSILPMQLRELIEASGGRGAVLETLRKIPGITVSETAVAIPETSVLDGLFAPEASLAIPETAGKGWAVVKTVTPTVKNLGGKVFLGQDILTRLMAENPRALFYLLKTYSVFVEQNESPVLLTVGSPNLISQIKDALVNRNSGLRGFEISERAALLEALEAGKILEVIEPAQGASEAQIISREAAKTGGGIASLHLSAAMIPGLAKGVHFAFGENVGARDLMVASVFAIVLKSAADLIYNIPDAKARAELLGKFFEENLPGVQMKKQGSNSFVITQITMLAQEFAARAYIATRA